MIPRLFYARRQLHLKSGAVSALGVRGSGRKRDSRGAIPPSVRQKSGKAGEKSASGYKHKPAYIR